MIHLSWIDRKEPANSGKQWPNYPLMRDFTLVLGKTVRTWSVHFHCGMPMKTYHKGEWTRCVNPFCKYDHILIGGCKHGGKYYP